ncbi:MAG: sigma 54-interacting transcriptional regulator, partial [Candidatus Methylomirabilales bacterium]
MDITGPAKKAHALTFALTVAIARSIEQLFLVFELQRREALRTISRGFDRRWPGESILVVSESGRVVEMNSAATRAFGRRPAALTNAPLAELIPELWTPVQQSAESRSAVEQEIAVRMPTGAEKTARCRVEPIIREGRTLGSVVILSDRSSAPTRERSRTAMRSPGPGPTRYTFADILGDSPVLRETLNLARAAAQRSHPVLLVGESGTGKELVAHAIHAESRRASGPFVAVDCGALPRELVESELFGHAPG